MCCSQSGSAYRQRLHTPWRSNRARRCQNERASQGFTYPNRVGSNGKVRLQHAAICARNGTIVQADNGRHPHYFDHNGRCDCIAITIGELVGKRVTQRRTSRQSSYRRKGVVGYVHVAAIRVKGQTAEAACYRIAYACSQRRTCTSNHTGYRAGVGICADSVGLTVCTVRIHPANTGDHIAISHAGRRTSKINRFVGVRNRNGGIVHNVDCQSTSGCLALHIGRNDGEAVVHNRRARLACCCCQRITVIHDTAGSVVSIDCQSTLGGRHHNGCRSAGHQLGIGNGTATIDSDRSQRGARPHGEGAVSGFARPGGGGSRRKVTLFDLGIRAAHGSVGQTRKCDVVVNRGYVE